MTPDERNLLTGFLNDLAQARAGAKDPDADALIRNALSSNPDAAYLLVQHSILSDQALHAAQDQIQQLQAQLQSAGQPAPQASFFGGARPATSVPPTGGYGAPPPQPQYQPQPQGQGQAQGMWGAPPPQPFSGGGGGLGSFLRNAGTMAAGVAGGEFLFSGLHGLFGGGRGFGGGFGGGGFGGPAVENVTVNEYNDNGGGDYDDGGDGDYGDDDGGDDGGY